MTQQQKKELVESLMEDGDIVISYAGMTKVGASYLANALEFMEKDGVKYAMNIYEPEEDEEEHNKLEAFLYQFVDKQNRSGSKNILSPIDRLTIDLLFGEEDAKLLVELINTHEISDISAVYIFMDYLYDKITDA